VSIKRRLCVLLLCLPILLGAGMGMAMRPEEIEDLIHNTNQQTISYALSTEPEKPDETLPKRADGEL
jgi:hypothetical protein